ncbi:MAG: BTAD domain-containing putative transcriptional regulator [Anaerosomatales bacterium]|nr:BTAD domain-containing putative transcriptional regulator [Anaerosomatales bacterium]
MVRKIGSTEEVAGILARVGEEMLTGGSHEDVRWWLQQIPPSVKMELPSLTLLEAHLLRDSMKFSDASRTLEATERLAEHSCDIAMQLEAAISRAILAWAFGHLAKGSEALRQVLLAFPESQRTAHIRARAWLLLLSGNELPAAVMRERCDQLESALAETGDQGAAVCATYNTLGVIRALILGDIIPARKLFRLEAEWEASRSSGLGVGRANEALLLLTAGRLESARRILRPVLEDPRSVSSELHFAHFMSTVACIFAGLGDYDKSLTYCERSFRYSSRDCPAFHRILAHLELSEILRSAGRAETAHDEAETALLMLEGGEWRHFKFQAATERLASRLALGDEALVYEEGLELRKTLEGTGYSFYLLRLDMVLAEIERRRGELDKAASRIAEHAEHIRGEGSNWHMAMYTRAFPGLLSVFARALGPDGIPIHMLRMLLEPTATRALEMAQGTLDEHAFRRLVLRTLGKAKGAEFLSAHEGPPVLRVRLFGGLSVEGPQGPVPDKAWGKRKARLLFAMLAIELGRDVPRDIIFDRLWPDMPADRAQSNFYVTWSYMKKALAACAGDPAPYLEHRGGVCRVVPEFVTTDLAEFFHAAEALRKAKAGGEPESVIDAAERMAGLYAGELLAGDLYEDWCSETRERVRHEFSDAMLAGAEALADRGEPSRAVRLVRAALAHDPWREDLYQAALRYQIMAGQRSGAIETYMACRDRLAEDLGLDPSVETQRLYEQVLAMEEGAEAVPA